MFSLQTSTLAAVLCLLGLALNSLTAQVPVKVPAPPAVPVIRATTRVVPVDIVVTDDHGKAVHNLPPSEFLISQDKKQQKGGSLP